MRGITPERYRRGIKQNHKAMIQAALRMSMTLDAINGLYNEETRAIACPIHLVSDGEYRSLAAEVLQIIGESMYCKGEAEYDKGPNSGYLQFSVIIYRDFFDDETGHFSRIKEVIPIGWKYETRDEEGEKIENNFRWEEFVEYLI